MPWEVGYHVFGGRWSYQNRNVITESWFEEFDTRQEAEDAASAMRDRVLHQAQIGNDWTDDEIQRYRPSFTSGSVRSGDLTIYGRDFVGGVRDEWPILAIDVREV